MDTLGAKPKRATEQDRLVGERIVALRKARGLSQAALGGLLPVSRTPCLGVKVKPEVLHAASQVRT